MIKTKRVYDPVENSDGLRVLIMRKWPQGIGYRKNNKRGMIDIWCKELGPSKELLAKWNKNEITWKNYFKQYTTEQASKPEAKAERDFIIRKLTEEPDIPITFLCKEQEYDPHCHRHILKDILRKEM